MGSVNHKIWHAGNDGAGSGLDADLLDGLSSASFVKTTGGTISGDLISSRICINRNVNANSAISWYSPSYNSWQTYMAPAGQVGSGYGGNLTAPSGTYVTSWGLRNVVEGVTGYGWTFEKNTNNGTAPTVVAEIRATDGAAIFSGPVRAAAPESPLDLARKGDVDEQVLAVRNILDKAVKTIEALTERINTLESKK